MVRNTFKTELRPGWAEVDEDRALDFRVFFRYFKRGGAPVLPLAGHLRGHNWPPCAALPLPTGRRSGPPGAYHRGHITQEDKEAYEYI